MRHLQILKPIIAFASLVLSMGPAYGQDSGDSGSTEDTYYPAILEIDPGQADETISYLENEGVIIWGHRDELLLVCVPETLVGQQARIRGVNRIERDSRSKYNTPAMDKAVEWHDAYKLHTGEGLPVAFTGSGVVVGLTDTGIDTNHPCMLSDDGKELRIKRMTIYDEGKGKKNVYSTPEEILNVRTDRSDRTHGTHVANILAGGNYNNPYPGMAPGAEIVASGSRLSDTGILAGAEDIIAYAKSVEKPCVINISMANHTGPHDGTSLFCRYIDKLAQDAIICISSGNSGNSENCISNTFTAEKPEMRFVLRAGNSDDLIEHEGRTELWNSTSTPLRNMTLYLYHTSGETIQLPTAELGETGVWSISSVTGEKDYNADFAAEMEGVVQAQYGVDSYNGRYYVQLDYSVKNLKTAPLWGQERGKWRLAFSFTGDEGVHTDVYPDMVATIMDRWSADWQKPTTTLSINDLCTGKDVVSVGMYVNRQTYPKADGTTGSTWDTGIADGDVSINSSYGTLIDGRVLPLTVAPGTPIVSAYSGAYMEGMEESARPGNACLIKEIDGKSVYWGIEGGTSMSCPYVAGCIATWLEACPNLTVSDVQDIIKQTNLKYVETRVSDNPKWGDGEFNPVEGLKLAIKKSVTGISMADGTLRASARGGKAVIVNPTGKKVEYMVCDITGRILHSGSSCETQIYVEAETSGCSLLRIEAPGERTVSLKLLR